MFYICNPEVGEILGKDGKGILIEDIRDYEDDIKEN
jgi:hypothetical protein